MNKLILAFALVTPAAFAAAPQAPVPQETHTYQYGEVLDVNKVIALHVVTPSSTPSSVETVELVYQDRAGVVHDLYYQRVAESVQDS